MAKKAPGFFLDLVDIMARFPWWVGLAAAVVSYALLHPLAAHPIPQSPGIQGIGVVAQHQLLRMVGQLGQYLFPGAFLLGALGSIILRAKRHALHAVVAKDDSGTALRDMSWSDFEKLVGEAFRRQGYQVTELGGGAPDGGVDLIVVRGGQRYLVQCKQWKAWSVGVKVVRELLGVVTAQGAAGGFVVTSGAFTKDAQAFADANGIKLLDGASLQAAVERGASATSGAGVPRLSALVLAAVVVLCGLAWLYTERRATVTPPRAPIPVARPAIPAMPAEAPALAKARREHELEKQFEAQYVPPKGCEHWKTDRDMVECANKYIRAKRAFLAAHGG